MPKNSLEFSNLFSLRCEKLFRNTEYEIDKQQKLYIRTFLAVSNILVASVPVDCKTNSWTIYNLL